MTPADMSFDRTVSDRLLDCLRPGGPFAGLVARCHAEPGRFDVQLRREPKGTRSWASFYVGLTTVLDVDERNGSFRLRAAQTHRDRGGFDEQWRGWQPLDALVAQRAKVEAYLDRVIDTVDVNWTNSEGAVHGAICCGRSGAYRVIQREASIGFRDIPTRDAICKEIADPITSAVAHAGGDDPVPWWPRNKRLGTALDVLAVGLDGRLLAIEAKPANALAGIVWGPAQVGFYAEMYARWLRQTPTAVSLLAAMLEQRVALGLEPDVVDIALPVAIVPVLAVGPGPISAQAAPRMRAIATAVDAVTSDPTVAPLEVWRVDQYGAPKEWP